MRLKGDNNFFSGGKCVKRKQTKRWGTVNQQKVEILFRFRDGLTEDGFPANDADQLAFGTDEVNI